MPKVARSISTKISNVIRDFPNETFSSDNNVLYCNACDISVSTTQKFQITQHISTSKHKSNKERLVKKQVQSKQQFLTSSSSKCSFNIELCRAMIKADIPLAKLDNPHFKEFLEKNIGKSMPDRSTLRKNYVSTIYEETLLKIRDLIQNGPIWVSIDESTDVEGRYVGNVIVGKLNSEPSEPILLTCENLEKCNHKTIAKLFNDSMSLIWPNNIQHEQVLLFVTDAAPYMIKAANALEVLYPKMIHLTCLAHALHRVAETVRCHYPDVDLLISTIKRIFLKAPSRIEIFKNNYPNIPLPPEPIITRWGTWLEAVNYYSKFYDEIKNIVSMLDSEHAASISKGKEIFERPNIKSALSYIVSNFSFLGESISKLENTKIPLSESIQIIDLSISKINESEGPIAELLKNKMNVVLNKNSGLKTIKCIRNILCGIVDEDTMELNLSPSEITAMKYAPITSCDVERSFSRYKSVLRPNRRSFNLENLKQYMVCHCFPYN